MAYRRSGLKYKYRPENIFTYNKELI